SHGPIYLPTVCVRITVAVRLNTITWRTEPTDVEELADELWLGVKCHSNLELAGSPRNGSRSTSKTMGDKLHRREGNNPDHQLSLLNDRSVIKEVGVERQSGGLPRSSHP
ncbi:hypothetical protein Golob_026799, partial [Gossypium lobatum]|nr:hypothetical protein [Gossypium lobatum]